VVLPLGLAFIALTLKDVIEEVTLPGKKHRKETLKKRRILLMKRRKALTGK
jgi:hypothetical protein